jgi:hypothetical protein
MTPTAPELLMGCVAALSTPPAEEDGIVYVTGKIGLVAILDFFCAQECASGIAVRASENAALRSVLGSRSNIDDGDLSLAANAELRRRVIHLHETAEAAGDTATDRKILALYRQMAARRLLHLPPSSAAA